MSDYRPKTDKPESSAFDESREDFGAAAEGAKEEARDTAERVKQEAADTGQEVKQQAQEAAQEVKAEVQDAAEQVAREAQKAVGAAREQFGAAFTENKTRAADELHSVAQAFQVTGKNLREQDQAPIAQYAEQLGDQVERVSGYLRDRDLGTMLSDLERFARREPGLFIGGAVAVGLLATRFLKSSSTGGDGGRYSYTSRQAARGSLPQASGYTGSDVRMGPDEIDLGGETGLSGGTGLRSGGTTGLGGETGLRNEMDFGGETGLGDEAGLRGDTGFRHEGETGFLDEAGLRDEGDETESRNRREE